MLDIQTGQKDRTNANNSVENIIDFTQDPLSPYAKKEFSLLNVPIVKGLIKFPSIIIPDETPIEAVDRLDILFNRTILVLSRNIPHDPCWIYYWSTDVDGYARHNPSKLTEPEKGFRSDSHLVHRWVYQYLFMPKGILELNNEPSKSTNSSSSTSSDWLSSHISCVFFGCATLQVLPLCSILCIVSFYL